MQLLRRLQYQFQLELVVLPTERFLERDLQKVMTRGSEAQQALLLLEAVLVHRTDKPPSSVAVVVVVVAKI
jgi:hypothetical protein